MDFREATDTLTRNVNLTLADVAETLGVAENTVIRARMQGVHSRNPPKGWREKLSRLAWDHIKVLDQQRDRLEDVIAELGKG